MSDALDKLMADNYRAMREIDRIERDMIQPLQVEIAKRTQEIDRIEEARAEYADG